MPPDSSQEPRSALQWVWPSWLALHLRALMDHACHGAVIAGLYGALHDQITFSISPEYFTQMKYQQFEYANFGLGDRVFVAEIGFLGTWWVGGIVGWSLARLGLMASPGGGVMPSISSTIDGCVRVLPFAVIGGLLGAAFGLWVTSSGGEEAWWREVASGRQIQDVRRFTIVLFIHLFGYLGALVGSLFAGRRAWVSGRRCGGHPREGTASGSPGAT